MRFSYVMLPDYPLEESLRAIKLADELGFYACYAADETWHKDLWRDRMAGLPAIGCAAIDGARRGGGAVHHSFP